jgi:AbrB family looped-hinge helix DNA binding protein
MYSKSAPLRLAPKRASPPRVFAVRTLTRNQDVGRFRMTHKSHTSRKRQPVGTVVVHDRGRVVLPAEFRRSLGLRPGDELVAELQPDRSLQHTPRQVLAERDRGAFAHLAGKASLVDELIADRRAEAARDDASA